MIRHLEYRMHTQKMSNFIIETGKKGAGKSWLGLRLGEVINGEDFSMNNVCFSAKTFFERLHNKDYGKGDVVMLEELGISANARDAMSRTNKHLSFMAQAIRPARITLIANTISWGLIDCQIKNMADYRLNVIGYDALSRLTEFKFMKISPNENGTEPFKEHLQFNGHKYVSWVMGAPKEELAKEYDKARDEYLTQLYSDGQATLNGVDDVRFGVGKRRDKRKTVDYDALENKIVSTPTDYMVDGKLNISLIQSRLRVSISTARAVFFLVKDKVKANACV